MFGNQFNITGMTSAGAHELALLLRAGSLVTPIYSIEERAMGPRSDRKTSRRACARWR